MWIASLNRAMPKDDDSCPNPLYVTFGMPVRLREGEDKVAFLERARAACSTASIARGATPARQTIFLFLAIGCVLIAATWSGW